MAEMEIIKGGVGQALTSKAKNHVIAVADDVYDENLQKYQSEINMMASSAFDVTSYNSGTTYSGLTEALAGIPDTYKNPGMNIKFVNSDTGEYSLYTYKMTTTGSTEFNNTENWYPAIASLDDNNEAVIPGFDPYTDTLHITSANTQTLSPQEKQDTLARLGLGNGTVDAVPTSGSTNLVESGGVFKYVADNSGVFDITAYNNGTAYSGLTEALNAVPFGSRKGGMSVKYVQTSDNKYVQYRYMDVAITGSPNPFLDTNNWQDVDYKPKIEQLIKGEIVETLSFEMPYNYTKDDFISIPQGVIITEVSGASTSVYGYGVKDGEHIALSTGVVTPYQINFLRSINWNGQITLKYKTIDTTKFTQEIAYLTDAVSTIASDNLSLFYSIFNKTVNIANPADFEEGYYIIANTGEKSPNSSYTASGYIPVIAGQSYYMSYKHQIAWYKKDKTYLSGSPLSDSVKVQVAPEGAKYLRCTIHNNVVSTFIVAQSSQEIPYTPYGDTIKENAIAPNSIALDKLKPQSPTDKAYFNAIGNVASGDMIDTTDFPFFVKKGLAIAFYAKITSFDTLYIGKGYNKYRGHWVKIDNTNITVEKYDSIVTTIATVEHGLTLSTYIKINIVQNNDGTTDIVLQTFGGDFKYTVTYVSHEWNYELFVRSTNTVLTDAILTATIQDIDKPIWLFGDSYFGVNNERVIGQLKNLGLFNYLVEGLAGEDSIGAYADLQRLLTLGKPKYIVWCLGMNDTDANFTTYFNNVKSYCERYGITMIGYTVPTVPSRNKETISALVRNSGLRYIDAYKAVGADSDGNWYTGYLSSDGVHPTTIGAKAIALQWTIDFPELYIYCRYKDDVILQNPVGVDN